MRYPRPLQPGDLIAITAPSSGVDAPVLPRLELAEQHLKAQGYRIREGACLHGGAKHVSASVEARVKEFTDCWLDPDVAAIFPPWGGELLMELLALLDFERMTAAPPKWLLGYSDISTLLFPLTLLADCATAHGTNLMEQVPGQTDPLARECLGPLRCVAGGSVEQASSARHQTKWFKYEEHPERGFGTEGETRWKVLGPDPDARAAFSGRIIGGCVDTLANLAGTPFGDLPAFRRRYAADGLILYLENCELPPPHFARNLWQLAYAGWFEGLAGLVFGRTGAPDAKNPGDYSFRDALAQTVGRLGFPVIYDADIGHVPPQLTIVNGARAEVSCEAGKGRLKLTLTS